MTPKERACLDAIVRLTVDGVSPSFREVAAELGLKGIAGVARFVHNLEAQGHIATGAPNERRAIRVINCGGPYDPRSLAKLPTDRLRQLVIDAADALNDRMGYGR